MAAAYRTTATGRAHSKGKYSAPITGTTATSRIRVSWLARLKRAPVSHALSPASAPPLATFNVAPLWPPLKGPLFFGGTPNLGDGRPQEDAHDPVRSDPHLALGAVQAYQIGHSPENGRDHPGEPYAHHLVDGEVASQLDELAERLVLELFEVPLIVQGFEHVAGGQVALLDRGLRGRRDDSAVPLADVVHGSAVAYGPDVAVALHPQCKVYLYACPLVMGQPEVLYRLVRAVARSPDHVLRIYLLAALQLDAVAHDLLGHGACHNLDALVEEPGAGGAAQGGVELGQDVWQGLYKVDPDAVRVDIRVVGREVLVDEGVDLGGHLDPGSPAPDNHKSELGLWHLVADEGDLLEALYDAVAQAHGVPDSPHGHAVLLDTGDAEKVWLPAQGDYELIVRELETAVGLDDVPFCVYALDLGPSEACPGEDKSAPQGLGDVARVDVAADDPWHHRPEGKVVVARYDQNSYVIALPDQLAQVRRRRVPSEPPTDDQNLLLELAVGWLLPGSVPGCRVERPSQGTEPQDQPAERQPTLDQSVHTSLPRRLITAATLRSADPSYRKLGLN